MKITLMVQPSQAEQVIRALVAVEFESIFATEGKWYHAGRLLFVARVIGEQKNRDFAESSIGGNRFHKQLREALEANGIRDPYLKELDWWHG